VALRLCAAGHQIIGLLRSPEGRRNWRSAARPLLDDIEPGSYRAAAL
jgi:hypothetical protein